MDKHFNPIVCSKLQTYAQSADWQGMKAYLDRLSHSAFRTAGYVLAEKVLPSLSADDYWDCFCIVALSDTKAFLITFLKAALQKYHDGSLTFSDDRLLAFGRSTASLPQSLDRQKTLKTILPVLHTPTEVQDILNAFCTADTERKAGYLALADESMPCYYVLFQMLRQMDHNPDGQVKILAQVIRRSTPLAYNFVSVMRAYFGITRLGGSYSLTLQPYQLSGIESGYEGFSALMNKIK